MIRPLEASVCSDDDCDATFLASHWLELIGRRIGGQESILVFLKAAILGIAPINVAIVDLARFGPDPLTVRVLRVITNASAALFLIVAEAIRSVASKAIEADIVLHAENLV